MKLGIILLAALLAGCGRKIEEHPGQVAVWCKVVSTTDSGQRRYCGKACWAPVYVVTYECPQRGAVTQ